MPFNDFPLDELRRYDPAHPAPPGFDAFWQETLDEARSEPIDATFAPIDNGLAVLDTFDVTFAGFGASPIKGWLHVPAGTTDPRPAIVEYVGYGGGRGLPHERTLWAAAGYAHLVMDTRGQGSTWSSGDTPDPDGGGDPAHPGFLTAASSTRAATTTAGCTSTPCAPSKPPRQARSWMPAASSSPVAVRAARSRSPPPRSNPASRR